nr:hypothetical protein [Tanacetum cinerariifolium]
MSNPHKNWLVQKQTALGKDTPNPLMADNLPKLYAHHVTFIKSWLVQKQTALGKDTSNPLMADNLLKIVWYSAHHVTFMKSWLVQKQTALGQTATGKEISNLFIAGSLPKTIRTTFIHQTNDVTRLQALVDKKKVVVTEDAIREVLRLDDAKGVDCLPNEEIFTELARMGYEKPSTKLTFYKAFFSSQRVEHLEYDKVAQALEITKLKSRVKKLGKAKKVKVLKLRRLKKVGTSQIIDTSEDTVMDNASNQGRMIDDLDKDDVVAFMDDKEEEKKEEEAKEDEPSEVHEVVDVVTNAKLITKVVTAASETVTAASTIISAAEPQVLAATITAAPVRVVVSSTKRRKGVVIRDPEEESSTFIPADTKSKDKGKGIMVEEPKPLKKKQQVKMNEEYERKLHAELNKDID